MQDALTLAIVGHLVGDYLLQNDWMALNKKKHSFPCFVHCFIWACSVCLFSGWGNVPWLFLFVTHFVQDRTFLINWWMRLWWKDQSKFMQWDEIVPNPITGTPEIKPGLGPWSIIVVDNVWHIVSIWAVWKFLL